MKVPTAFLLGQDRNCQRVRRLMATIEGLERKSPNHPKLPSLERELEKRIGGGKPKRAVGASVNVGTLRK